MFKYPSLSSSTINEMRFYETPEGKFYPSITTVLGKTLPKEKAAALKNWQNSLGTLADKKSKEAADRGTAVHLLAERYLKKEQLIKDGEKFEQSDINCFNALKLKLNKIKDIWCQEEALYSDLLGVAGRTDCIAIYNGKPCIIDFKTSSRIKTKSDIDDYNLQLCAYSIMHNEMFGTDIADGVILMTSSGGFPQEFNVNLLNYVDKLVERVDNFYNSLI